MIFSPKLQTKCMLLQLLSASKIRTSSFLLLNDMI